MTSVLALVAIFALLIVTGHMEKSSETITFVSNGKIDANRRVLLAIVLRSSTEDLLCNLFPIMKSHK